MNLSTTLSAARGCFAHVERNFQQRFGLAAAAFVVGITVLVLLGAKEYLIFASLLLQATAVALMWPTLQRSAQANALQVNKGLPPSPRAKGWLLIAEILSFALLTLSLAFSVFSMWSKLDPNANVLLAGRLPFVFVHSGFCTAFVLVPHLFKRFQQAEADATVRRNSERLQIASLERSLALSELKTLQAQIEPHFLYNVLANVQSMVKLAPDTADAMLKHLIDYLKLALPSMRGGESCVAAELDLARAYLAIAQLRFGDRLQVRVVCDAPLAQHAMPPMLLLPLVENAVKHGVEPKPGAVQVDIDVRAENGALTFRVVDDGAGFTHDGGSGIGIANVRERLAALFNGHANVSVEPLASGGVVSTLTLPMSA